MTVAKQGRQLVHNMELGLHQRLPRTLKKPMGLTSSLAAIVLHRHWYPFKSPPHKIAGNPFEQSPLSSCSTHAMMYAMMHVSDIIVIVL